MPKWGIVVPSNRPERLQQWRNAWGVHFVEHGHDVKVYEVIDLPPWNGIPTWIPRCTDGIRSWGFFQAWRDGAERILSMDDDVLPAPGVDLLAEYDAAFERTWPVAPCFSVGALTGTGLEMRGFPLDRYGGTDLHPRAYPLIQYGGWDGVPDLDGRTQLQNPDARSNFARIVLPVPDGAAVTTCAMNFAFYREATPYCWQLTQVEGRYDRWHDIWSGLIQKRILDDLGLPMLVNGRASVIHDRASDPHVNVRKERPGLDRHILLWEELQAARGFIGVTDAFAERVGAGDRIWRETFIRARDAWWGLFQ
jgi:hypothetical protein